MTEVVVGENPSWLTKDYLEQVLRDYYANEELSIESFNVIPALGKGDNYGSIIYRVNIIYKSQANERTNLSLVIKSNIEYDEYAQTVLGPYEFFKREIKIYNDVLPKLEKLLQEIGQDEIIFPATYKADSSNEAIIFEDLKEAGFVLADRRKRLDMAHIRLTLEKLAKMHVASIILNEREQNVLTAYDFGFFNRHTDVYKSYYVENLKACANMLKDDERYAFYGDKLIQLAPVYMEMGACVFDVNPYNVNVFNHGDLWTCNIMFKYDAKTGLPIDARFLDFQCAAWASPAVDLHYFINTSAKEEIRQSQTDELVKYYYDIFRSIYKAFKKPIEELPHLHAFQLQMDDKRFYALHSSFCVQPVMIADATENADYNAVVGIDERAVEFKKNLYRNKNVQNIVKTLVAKFEHLGLLEITQT